MCLATLGPGALNFTNGAAYALLGAMPMIMITGQKGILSQARAFPSCRHCLDYGALDQNGTADRQCGDHSDRRARCLPAGATRTAGTRAYRTARRHCGGANKRHSASATAPDRNSGRKRRGLGSRGRSYSPRAAPPGHVRGGCEPAAACPAIVGFRGPSRRSIFQHANGQGLGLRRLGALHGNGGPVRARLCAPGDRPR